MSPNVHQIYRKVLDRPREVLCQYQDEAGNRCSKSAISSHTVQKARALAAIAQVGHVLHIRFDGFRPANEGRVAFDKIGVRKASIFPGFCSDHDHSLFESIETGTGAISERERALLSFRSVCHELFKKETVISAYSDQELRRVATENGQIVLIDAHLKGCELARLDLLRSKASHLGYLHGKFGKFSSALFRLNSGLPFAFSTAFAPEFDLYGDDMLPPEAQAWGNISCFAGQIKGESVFLLAGFDDVEHHAMSKFISSLSSLPSKRVGGFALHMALEYAENCYFRPSWVNALLPEVREKLIRRFKDGTPGVKSQIKKELAQQFDIVRVGGQIQVG